MTALTQIGQVVSTPAALEVLESQANASVDPAVLLRRHVSGDWGDVDPEDFAANTHAAANGGRVVSAYKLPDGNTVWIITEWDRSATTFLLPSDY